MKNILFALSVLLIFGSCQPKTEKEFVLVIENQADSLIFKSADQLAHYWQQITEREINIIHENPKNKIGIYIGKSWAPTALTQELNPSEPDAYIISIKPNEIFLCGNQSLSTFYAVNTFLEEQLHCIKLTANENLIPKNSHPQFKDFLKVYHPDFSFRRILFKGQKDQSYREWYKLDELDEWGMFVHTFHRLVPPEAYFNKHPEYFSLVNGRRLKDAQLCLSNPELIDLLTKNLGKEMEKKPEKTIWSVSQNDAYNYCECDNCQNLYDKYDSYSGAYIEMANSIAQAFPDKQISTLAYQFTREAPKNIEPLPNVNIMFCSIECNRSMPLVDDPRSKSFVKDMKDWSAISSNIFLWDYVVQFKNYLTPFPNFPVLQKNIQFFKDHGVSMMFQQGSNGNWSDLSELKQFLIAKLLWDTELDVDSLATGFINAYYGDAAPYIKKYYDKMNEDIQTHAETEFLNIYGFPSDYVDSYLSPDLMLYYKSLMDNAEIAVVTDSLLLNRVKRARLPIDFAYVDIAINHNFEEMPCIINSGKSKEIHPQILELLNKLEDYAIHDQAIRINERNFKIKDYKTYVLNKLSLQMKPNKLEDALIKIQTNYSDTYPVGGEKALNDQLFGALDYHKNWLGFQGEDMLVEIDLLKEVEISEVQMNFLKAVNSWVFLPLEVMIETSKDGFDYHEAASLKGDISDQNYLVKSIPFVFNMNPVSARYLRITAESLKTCPEWHRGYGKPSWIFIDEIIVN